jgi:hypothetical protein
VWDIWGSVNYVDSSDAEALSNAGLSWFPKEDLGRDVQAITEIERWSGFAAYRALAGRIPVFWPIIPLLYVWPIRVAGERFYRRVADSRTCSLPKQKAPTLRSASSSLQLVRIGIVGTILVTATFLSGALKEVSGWPFACYPTFSSLPTAELTKLRLFAEMPEGQVRRVEFKGIPYHRLYWMLLHTLDTHDSAVREKRLRSLWVLAMRNDPSLQGASSAIFYKDIEWVAPELWQRNPKERETIYTMDLTPCTQHRGDPAQEICGRPLPYSKLPSISQD